jgi:hypothetical protein
MPIIAEADGSITYQVPLTLTEVTVDGVSILDKQPVEMRVWPGGWGYVCTLVNLETGESKRLVDGQTRNYTRWGKVEVTL